jgi:hypothetical protein
MPSYTPERSWTNGDAVAASDLNTYLRDNVDYVYGQVTGITFSGCTLTRVAATSIPDATNTAITWTTERKDVGGWYSSGTQIIVPAGAIPSGSTTIAIKVEARTIFAADATGRRRVRLLKNGTPFRTPSYSGDASDDTEVPASGVEFVVATDIITVELYQNSGGSLNASETIVDVYRLGPVD